MKNVRSLTPVLLFLLFLTVSCQKETVTPGPTDATNKTVHLDELAQDIEDLLGPGCVGLQYTISQNGVLKESDAVGSSRLEADGGQVDYNNVHRKSFHSCSKTITAAAMIHAMNKFNINLEDKIGPYLPERWDLSASAADNLSFRRLLNHTSGLRGTSDSYASMKEYIEAGDFSFQGWVDDGQLPVRYANINFTLMRILIPMIDPSLNGQLNITLEQLGADAFAAVTAAAYIDYVRKNVLIANEISEDVAPKIWDDPAIDTYHYNFSNQSVGGYTHTDQTLLTGAGGWYMNTEEYSAFLAYLFQNNLPGIDPEVLINGQLGLFTGQRLNVDIYRHNGASAVDASGRGGRADWIHFPDTDVTVVIQINSANNAFSLNQSADIIVQAYKDAYY